MTLVEQKLHRGRAAFGSGEGTVENVVLNTQSSMRGIQAELFTDIWKCRHLEPGSSREWVAAWHSLLQPHISHQPLYPHPSLYVPDMERCPTHVIKCLEIFIVFLKGGVSNCASCIKNVWKDGPKTCNSESGYWGRWKGNIYIYIFFL